MYLFYSRVLYIFSLEIIKKKLFFNYVFNFKLLSSKIYQSEKTEKNWEFNQGLLLSLPEIKTIQCTGCPKKWYRFSNNTWKRLLTRTVLVNNSLLTWTIPVNKELGFLTEYFRLIILYWPELSICTNVARTSIPWHLLQMVLKNFL